MFSMIFMILGLGCTTGENFPADYADAICTTAYKCMNNSDIETYTSYDDIEDCLADWMDNMTNTSDYEAWEEGELAFNKDMAKECLTEITEVQQDSDCDGSMNVLEFFSDIQSDSCSDVYHSEE